MERVEATNPTVKGILKRPSSPYNTVASFDMSTTMVGVNTINLHAGTARRHCTQTLHAGTARRHCTLALHAGTTRVYYTLALHAGILHADIAG